ncbi:MAG: cbb3-type cytochrome oxidase assembly protein CcoS [Bacteroidota bacterium]
MNIIFLLILVSLVIAIGFLAAFIWAVKSGQYEDDYTPSVRMLFEDKPASSLKYSGKPELTSGPSVSPSETQQSSSPISLKTGSK